MNINSFRSITKRERRLLLKERSLTVELINEIHQISKFLKNITEKDYSLAKKSIDEHLLSQEKNKTEKELCYASNLEKKVQALRSRLDKQVRLLRKHLSINGDQEQIAQLGRIIEAIDEHEQRIRNFVGYPDGELIKLFNEKKVDWDKLINIAEDLKQTLENMLEIVRRLLTLADTIEFDRNKKKREKIVKSLIGYYSVSDVSYDSKVFFDAAEMYDSMIRDIEQAKDDVYLESYSFDPDKVGLKFVQVLIKKAKEFKKINEFVKEQGKKEGHRVIVVFDGVGSPNNKKLTGLFYQVIKQMKDAGVEVYIFNPRSHVFKKYSRLLVLAHPVVSFAGRNHRKILIIDHKIAYAGGMNISENYFNIRDTHVRIQGSQVMAMVSSFLKTLLICKNYEKYALIGIYDRIKKHKEINREIRKIRKREQVSSGCKVLVNNPRRFQHEIRDEYFQFIYSAHSEILINTPYFLPGKNLCKALSIAARRGVDVQIILSKETDLPFVDTVIKKYFKYLLGNGVQIFFYKHPRYKFIHAKTMVVDGVYSTIGSSNLDYASLSLNRELNFFFANKKIAYQLKRQFLEDLKYCTIYTLDEYEQELKNKSIFRRFKEWFAYGVLGELLKSKFTKYD